MSQITTKWITNNAITNAKLATTAAMTLLGNNSGSTGNVSSLSVSQVQTMLSIPTSSSPLQVNAGGTGNTSFTAYSIIAGGTTSTGSLQNIGTGTLGQILTSAGSSALPTWQNPTSTDWQSPVAAYANSNVPLTGSTPLVIDGYTVLNGDSLILGNQTTASESGVATAAISGGSYTLTDTGQPTAPGDAYLVLNGTQYRYAAFVAVSPVPTAAFVQFAGPTEYTFNAPLHASGTTISLNQGNGITTNSGNLIVNLAASSGLGFTSSQLTAEVDGSTITINGSNQLNVPASGITSTQLASAAVTTSKLATITDGITLDQSGSGSTLEIKTGGVGTNQLAASAVTPAKLGTVTDGITTNQSGSGSTIQSLRPVSYAYTLTSTDITNQYVDLDVANGLPSNDPAYGTSALSNSVAVIPAGGPMQTKGVDFTVGLTSGSSGSTRISFAGDLATNAMAGDVITFNYSYL